MGALAVAQEVVHVEIRREGDDAEAAPAEELGVAEVTVAEVKVEVEVPDAEVMVNGGGRPP